MKNADKILHFFLSTWLCVLLLFYFPAYIAVGITLGLGIIKEVWDKFRKNGTGFDLYDLIADVVGIGMGSILYLIFKNME